MPAPLISAPFIQPSSSASSLWGGGVPLTSILLEIKVKIPVSFAGKWGTGEVIALSCIHRHIGPHAVGQAVSYSKISSFGPFEMFHAVGSYDLNTVKLNFCQRLILREEKNRKHL